MIESPRISKFALLAKLAKVLFINALVVAMILPTADLTRAQGRVHTVAYGETLANIAYAYGVNSTELARANGMSNANRLYIGQELTIPSSAPDTAPVTTQPDDSTATSEAVDAIVDMITGVIADEPETEVAVQSSSSAAAASSSSTGGYVTVTRTAMLSQIAVEHGMSMIEIMRMNSLDDESDIWAGQQLYVTNIAATVAESSAATVSTTEEVATVATTAADTTAATTGTTAASADNGIHIVTYGDTLSKVAGHYGISSETLVEANGLRNANHVWIGQRLRIPGGANATVSQTTAWPQVSQSPAAYGRKLIEINLSNQTLTAWQGDQQMLHTHISSGTHKTPTVTGRYRVSWKTPNQHMYGDDFDLPNVPWVMYFYEGYAIHGTYWHNNFGMPMSHGCVNMVPSQAGFLYNWAPVGTEIWVHY